MTSKNERVNSFSFLFFCHAGEILVEPREKKRPHNPAIPSRVSVVFREQEKCK